MPDEVKWIKITTDMFEDEKIDYIQSLPEGDSILLIWIRLLTMAGKCNATGYIFLTQNIPYTDDVLAHKFKKPVNIIRFALETFRRLDMIQESDNGVLYITNFPKYQNLEGLEKLKLREYEREKKRKQREKYKALEAPNDENMDNENNVVPGNVPGTIPGTPSIIDIDKERDIDIEEDIDLDIYSEIQLLFNNTCITLPKIISMTANRKKTISTRWREHPSIEFFEQLFKKVNDSDFLSGRNKKWMCCCFDWIMRPSNLTKIIEGNYDNRNTGGDSNGQHGGDSKSDYFKEDDIL
jgi:predicted phage replisome organizer